MNREAVYKPLLYSKGYWLMVDADNNLHWLIIAPDGDTVSAIADTVERDQGPSLPHPDTL